ncbi:condensation domain-containing protein [Streptomyces sp. NPDC058373]|uniref:condensation domain-containing protein n=1 Tax=Streptomyces sp. NPDC058373 TaxID=3346465 RepID=UPI003652E72E
MRQFPLETLDVAPGRLIEWQLRSTDAPGGGGPEAARRASFNQDKHFTAAEQSRDADDQVASWIAVTFELPGPLDQAALEEALLSFVRRHEVLRCAFQRLAGDLSCASYDPGGLTLDAAELGEFTTTEAVRGFLAARFRATIDTLAWPLFTMGAVVRDACSTVYLAFDHIVCDGVSMPNVAHDIAHAYAAALSGDEPELPRTGSYLDFADTQRNRFLTLAADDRRLDHWRAFTERTGAFFPPFPLDLGVETGRLYPIVNGACTLLDAAGTAAFDQACRDAGGKPFMGVMAALARCLREAGGPDVYRALMPVSERGDGPWRHAVGWFVNTMPIEFPVRAGMELPDLMAGARAAFAEMIRHIDVPFVRAWELLAPEHFAATSWPYPVNFFSYIDMRRCPGAAHHGVWRPTTHVWSSRANGACLWFQRDEEGLHMNVIHVDTPQARRTMATLEQGLRRTVREIAGTGPARRPPVATLRQQAGMAPAGVGR